MHATGVHAANRTSPPVHCGTARVRGGGCDTAGLRHAPRTPRRNQTRRVDTRATYTGVPPVVCPSRVVDVVKLSDFTRLSLSIPESAAASVRVGSCCRVNGTSLTVASVTARHDGLGVVASFGVALTSPLSRTLNTLTAGASVSLEVETTDELLRGDSDGPDGPMDVAGTQTKMQPEIHTDGLPGTRAWYNHTLPWYAKMYPPVDGLDTDRSSDRASDTSVRQPTQPLRYDPPIGGQGSRSDGGGGSKFTDHTLPSSQKNPPPESPNRWEPNASGEFKDSWSARVIDGWSSSAAAAGSIDSPTARDGGGEMKSPPTARDGDVHVHENENENEIKRDMFSPSSARHSNTTNLDAPRKTRDEEKETKTPGNSQASKEVIAALTVLAKRNSRLKDNVETLLEMIELKGFGDAEVIDGLRRLEESSGKETTYGADGGMEPEFEKLNGKSSKASKQSSSVEKGDSVDDDAGDQNDETKYSLDDVSAETCVAYHPGVLCRTHSEVMTDEKKGTTKISMHVSVKAAAEADGRSIHISAKDRAALGARALVEAANDLASEKVAEAVRSSTASKQDTTQHETISRLLQTGNIVWVEAMSEVEGKYGHPCYRLRIEDNSEGSDNSGLTQQPEAKAIECVFKPKIDGDGDGWHRASMEYVAYKLSRLLGMDLVPPAAYRTGGIEVDYKTFDEGAFMYWVDDAKELGEVGDFGKARDTGCWGHGIDPRVVLSDTRVLDVLLQNSDRHSGHFLFGRHWTEGGGSVDAGDAKHENEKASKKSVGNSPRDGNGVSPLGGMTYRPVLIDHAASFRREAFVSMEHDNAFQTGASTVVKAGTYLRLRFLDARIIENEFSYFLSQEERDTLLKRRDTILAYLDDLVQKHGYDSVVIH